MSDKTMMYIGYGLTVLTVLFLLMDSGMKVAGAPVSIKATGDLGFDAQTTRTLGAILLLSTLLYAFPKTQILGAILVTAYLGGAVAIHVQQTSPLFSHALFGVYVGLMLWGGIWFRSPALRGLLPLSL